MQFPWTRVKRFVGTRDGAADSRSVLVEREKLIDRQREVLDVGYEMGDVDQPREATAPAVGEALGGARSTSADHLAAAVRTLLAVVLA